MRGEIPDDVCTTAQYRLPQVRAYWADWSFWIGLRVTNSHGSWCFQLLGKPHLKRSEQVVSDKFSFPTNIKLAQRRS